MAEPTIKIEIEFTTGVWTDVSAYLRRGNTRRGKSRATDSPSPGSAVFTMKNDARQFDPEYAANISPGNVSIDKALRSSVTYNAITYPLFYGQIDRIVQRYDGPRKSDAILECSDGLAKLANDNLGSPWEVQSAFLTPRAWYRLGEKQGPYATERIAGRHGSYSGTPVYGGAGFTHDDDSCIGFDTADDYLLLPPDFLRTDVAQPWQMSFLLNFPDANLPTPGNVVILMFDVLYPYGLTVWIDSNGFLNVRTWTPGAATYTYIRSSGFFGDVSMPVGGEDLGAFITIQTLGISPYIKILNGGIPIQDAATLIGTGSVLPSSYLVVGATPVPFRIDEIMTFDSNLSSGNLSLMANAAEGWPVDDADERINRILDAVGWPVGLRDITTEWDTFLQATDLNESPLEHMAKIAATAEHRAPFVTREGIVRILSRNAHNSAPYTVSQGVLGDGIGELGYIEMGDYAYDSATTENVVRRIWIDADGREYETVAYDAASLAAGQRKREGDPITSEYNNPDYEYMLAYLRATKLARPTPSVEGLKISPRKSPATLFPQVLGRELGDRMTWTRRPQNVGAAISRDVIVEGVSHDFAPKHWETTFLIDATDAFGYFLFDVTNWDADDWRFFG